MSGSGPWTWTCAGSNGGAPSPTCTANIPTTPVNGTCGSANGTTLSAQPTANLCSNGYASPVTGTGPWSWTCVGLNGGTTSPVCTGKVASGAAVNGVCSGANGLGFTEPPGNLCVAGNATQVTGSGPWSWTCVSPNGGATASCATTTSACNPTSTSTAESTITPTGIQADGAGNIFMSYRQCQNGFCSGLVAPLGGGAPIAQDPFLGLWAVYGNRNIEYTSDTVLYANGSQTKCGLIGGAMVANAAGYVYFTTNYTRRNRQYMWTNVSAASCSSTGGTGGVIAGAGSGCAAETDPWGDGCPASDATLSDPTALAVDKAGNLYIWDGSVIREINAVTNVITVAATPGCDTDPAISLAVNSSGTFYFTDGYGVYQVNAATGACGAITIPNLKSPVGVALDGQGALYVADSGNSQVIKATTTTGGSCGAMTPVNAYCGGAPWDGFTTTPNSDLCDGGTATPVTGSYPTWTWNCLGQNYGSNQFCGTYPAALTVTANNTSMPSGGPLPTFSASYSGFVNGDTAGEYLSGSPAFSTTATASSPLGTSYPITPSVGSLTSRGSYNFTFVPGTLTVIAAPKAQLSISSSVAKTSVYQATVTIANSGTADATNVTLTTATLNSVATTSPLPQNLGTVKAGASASVTVSFPLSAGADGATVVAKYAGTYTGGSFSSSARAVLP